MMKIFLNVFMYLSLVCSTLLIGTACEDKNAKDAGPQGTTNELKIGLIPEHDLFSQKKRFEPLAAYLSKKMKVTVTLKILTRYGNIIDNFISSELDGAFFGSFTGALAIKKLAIEPLARPQYDNGDSTYYGMIFTRKDSGIKNAANMKGKRFAFVDKATTAGWLLPMHYFQENGIDDYRTWFSETYFTGTHEDAIYDVLTGNADIGAAKNTVFYRLGKNDSRVINELQILTTSPKVPANGLGVRKDLDETLKLQLKNILLSMERDEDGRKVLKNLGAVRFIATTSEDYKPVFVYAENIGLDLATYDYINE